MFLNLCIELSAFSPPLLAFNSTWSGTRDYIDRAV